MSRGRAIAEFLRARGLALGGAAVVAVGAVAFVRWVQANRHEPSPRKVMQYTVVTPAPPPPVRPPPPPPVAQPKVEEPESTRVELKASEMMAPDAPRPEPQPAGGPLALAAEGEGPGDAFHLAGNPGGRSLTSGGALGDGTGDGVGGGGGGGSRFGWYYARVAADLEEAFRRNKRLSAASTRVELRVWADASGRIGRVELVRSTGDAQVDAAIQSVVGTRLREPPPADIPMPMIARLTARRPE